MLEKLFQVQGRGSDLKTETIAGITTFLTSAYIIFVHPDILSQAGIDRGAATTVTCLVAAFSTLLMALWCNAPLMMAPGMGLNAFFTYTLVIGEGIAWQTALGVVFLSGVFFLVLTRLGVRERIVHAIPQPLRLAASVGIGLFIAFIGMQNLGVVVRSDATMVTLGAITPAVLLGFTGVLIAAILEIRKVRGSILAAVLSTACLGMILDQSPPPSGLVSLPPSITPLAFQLDILGALKISFWASIFSFMFVDLFDSLGTMMAVCRRAGMCDEKGNIPDLPRMLTADAVATVGGALFGTSTTTTFLESASGVSEGGRTGLTSVVTACLFLAAAFFAPLVGAVPPYATAPALIIVGIYMIRDIDQVDFSDFEEAVPVFLTVLLMPLSYSISTGLAFGFISYVTIKLCLGRIRECDGVLIVIAVLSVLSLLL